MKKILLIVAGLVLIVVSLGNILLVILPKKTEAKQSAPPGLQPLHVQIIQDVSMSTMTNGVELVSSAIFAPYFAETHRSLQLSFSCISDASAKRPIIITLASFTKVSPVVPNLSQLNIVQKRKAKEQYTAERNTFIADSVAYFTDRAIRIAYFSSGVDSLINLYRNNLTRGSDVYTAIRITDDAFDFSGSAGAARVLIVNSDADDSFGRITDQLHNKPAVYLVNAATDETSSIDKVVTKRFVDIRQAIAYSLQNLQP